MKLLRNTKTIMIYTHQKISLQWVLVSSTFLSVRLTDANRDLLLDSNLRPVSRVNEPQQLFLQEREKNVEQAAAAKAWFDYRLNPCCDLKQSSTEATSGSQQQQLLMCLMETKQKTNWRLEQGNKKSKLQHVRTRGWTRLLNLLQTSP